MPQMSSVEDEGTAEAEALVSLKPGLSWPYVRSAAGEWLYEWGASVPGARDVHLRDLFRFEETETASGGAALAVPIKVWERSPQLAWCAAYWDPRSTSDVIPVPVVAWDAHDELVGMTAPEFSPDRFLDTDAVAGLLGVSPRTISNYLVRRLMPLPIVRIGGSPVWTEPVITHWIETRPGNGVDRRSTDKSPTSLNHDPWSLDHNPNKTTSIETFLDVDDESHRDRVSAGARVAWRSSSSARAAALLTIVNLTLWLVAPKMSHPSGRD